MSGPASSLESVPAKSFPPQEPERHVVPDGSAVTRFSLGGLVRLDGSGGEGGSVEQEERVIELEEALGAANRRVAVLERENAELTLELGRVYSESGGVPSPRTDAAARVLEQAQEGAFMEAVDPPGKPKGDKDESVPRRNPLEEMFHACGVQAVRQWGRAPAVAATMGPDVPSLCGMIAAVPSGVGDAALRDLGRRLRAALDQYENINVVLFDDLNAAKAFAERNADTPQSRVLQISRHSISGEDSVFVLRGGSASRVEMDTGN